MHLGQLRILKLLGKVQLFAVQKEHCAAGKGVCPAVVAAVHVSDGLPFRSLSALDEAVRPLHVGLGFGARRKALEGRPLEARRLGAAFVPSLEYARFAARPHRVVFLCHPVPPSLGIP